MVAQFNPEYSYSITKSLIDYPEKGNFGENILNLSKTEFQIDSLSLYDNFCLLAYIPVGLSLKIKISQLTGKEVWAYSVGSDINWEISKSKHEPVNQTFTAIHSGKSDLNILFYRGTYLIEYFEINNDIPNRTKTITIK